MGVYCKRRMAGFFDYIRREYLYLYMWALGFFRIGFGGVKGIRFVYFFFYKG